MLTSRNTQSRKKKKRAKPKSTSTSSHDSARGASMFVPSTEERTKRLGCWSAWVKLLTRALAEGSHRHHCIRGRILCWCLKCLFLFTQTSSNNNSQLKRSTHLWLTWINCKNTEEETKMGIKERSPTPHRCLSSGLHYCPLFDSKCLLKSLQTFEYIIFPDASQSLSKAQIPFSSQTNL